MKLRAIALAATIAIVSTTSITVAQINSRIEQSRVVNAATAQMTPPYISNFAVTSLASDGHCGVQVVVKNLGADVPTTIDQVGFSVKNDATAQEFKGTIPATQLRTHGSFAAATVPGLTTTYTAQSFTAQADSQTRDHRAGVLPTTVTQSLTCAATGQHLIYAVAFENDCTKKITVRNVGGGASQSYNTAVFGVARMEDGWSYKPFVSTSTLSPGREIEYHDTVKSFATYSSGIALGLAPDKIEIPLHCKGTAPNRRFELASLAVDPSSCRVNVTLKNTGSVPIEPDLSVLVHVTSPAGNDTLDTGGGAMATPPGGTATLQARFVLAPASANVTASMSTPAGNSTKTASLHCSH